MPKATAMLTNLFSAYKVMPAPGTNVRAYLIESTAPNNIDEPTKQPDTPPNTVPLDASMAMFSIASELRQSPNLPQHFSYFDCTDCVENGVGVVTLAKPGPLKKMTPTRHFWLLLCYLWSRKLDVHGGYFQSKFLSELIYRLAITGFVDTERAYGGETQLHGQLYQHQIKSLLKQYV